MSTFERCSQVSDSQHLACNVCHGWKHHRSWLWLQEITSRIVVPEVAFTGDTTSEFLADPANAEVFKARLLIMECTFLDDDNTPEKARVSALLCVVMCHVLKGVNTHARMHACTHARTHARML